MDKCAVFLLFFTLLISFASADSIIFSDGGNESLYLNPNLFVMNTSIAPVSPTPTPETPVSPGGGGSSGGGGGGSAVVTQSSVDFDVSRSFYEKTLVLDEVIFDRIQLTNNGPTASSFSVSVQILEDIVQVSDNFLTVNSGETKNIGLTLFAPNRTGIYPGKIIIKSGTTTKEINVIITVKTEKSLFDVGIIIPSNFNVLGIGNNLVVQINLLQAGIKEKMDVTLNYAVKDFGGETYLTESETIAVFDELSFDKTFDTSDLPSGNYVLGVELMYPDGVAVASSQFSVKGNSTFNSELIILWSALVMVIVVFVVMFVLVERHKKKIKKHLKK